MLELDHSQEDLCFRYLNFKHMNPYIKIIFAFVIVFISFASYGQRWKNDPTYSPHNYKHPNKAAAAAKEADVSKVEFAEVWAPVTRNYKAQNITNERVLVKVPVLASSETSNVRTNRNYKQQFVGTRRKATKQDQ